MRNMRKWMTGLLAAAMLLSLVACSGGEQAPPETESSGQEITLVADFSNGSELAEEFDLIQTETGIVGVERAGLYPEQRRRGGRCRHRGLGGRLHPGCRPG